MLTLAEVSGNSLILLGVLVVTVFAVAYGLYTVRGSGISKTPLSRQGSPGAKGPSEDSGVDQGQGSATGSDEHGSSDPQHGTQ